MTHALIVDDDVDAAMSLKLLIANAQLTVSMAHKLHEARCLIALQRPDLTLLDLQLPDGNGLALFDEPQLVANSEVVLSHRRTMAARHPSRLAPASHKLTTANRPPRQADGSGCNGLCRNWYLHGAGRAHHDSGHPGTLSKPSRARRRRPRYQPEDVIQPAKGLCCAGILR